MPLYENDPAHCSSSTNTLGISKLMLVAPSEKICAPPSRLRPTTIAKCSLLTNKQHKQLANIFHVKKKRPPWLCHIDSVVPVVNRFDNVDVYFDTKTRENGQYL